MMFAYAVCSDLALIWLELRNYGFETPRIVQNQTLKYHVALPRNIHFRNVNNNAGIFDYLIATAEDQETEEAALAYHFIRKAEAAPTEIEIASRVEIWLAENFEVSVD
jgi:hypothetical protein